MILENEIIKQSIKRVAEMMIVAARTAPKGRGVDNLLMAIAEKDDIQLISDKMKEIGNKTGAHFFLRDAENILLAPYMLLLAARISPMNLPNCGLCGLENCNKKNKFPGTPCVLNITDLGIAIGSAVSVAADHRVDNRVMFSVGIAAKELGLLGDEAAVVYGIPLSVSSKSPFFDRK